jgi:hypothetical protein
MPRLKQKRCDTVQVSGLDATLRILNTGSSQGMSRCTYFPIEQHDLDGSKPVGSESEPFTRGCPLEATTVVGTVANSPDPKMGRLSHLRSSEESSGTYTRCGPSGSGAAERLLRTKDEPRIRPSRSCDVHRESNVRCLDHRSCCPL